jgi:hypothetical protein
LPPITQNIHHFDLMTGSAAVSIAASPDPSVRS